MRLLVRLPCLYDSIIINAKKNRSDSVNAYLKANSTEYIGSSNLILAHCNASKNLFTVSFLLTVFIIQEFYMAKMI